VSGFYELERTRGVSWVSVGQGAAGPLELAAAVAGKRHKIIGGMIALMADGELDIRSGATSLMGGGIPFDARGGFAVPAAEVWLQTANGEALNLVTTGGAARGFLKLITE
jgi:hypothetical protein